MLSPFMRCAGWTLVGLLPLLTNAPCVAGPRAGDDLGPVASFSLLDRSGRVVRSDDLRGKVWVASFQFTRCTGPCPLISQTMQRLQNDFRDRPDVLLVTFTVDPEHDSPEELDRYAQRFGAEPDRWLFLTGKSSAEMHQFLRDSFRVYAAPREGKERTPGNEVDHQTYLVVVDRQGHRRGYYAALPDRRLVSEPGEVAGEVLSGSGGTRVPADPEEAFEQNLKRLRRQVDDLLLPEQPGYLPADFPQFNATLNGVCVVLLLLGYFAIRIRQVRLHAALMLSTIAVSALFLTSYLYYHLAIRAGRPTRFSDQAVGAPEWVAYLYLAILLTHTVLAVVATPLALYTAYQGLWGKIQRHVRIARWTLPIWLYVSVTGVVVYVMLYRLYP